MEDEGIVRAHTADYLRDSGFRVLEATDGPQALRMLAGGTMVDLVFADIVMPGLPDGFGLAHWIRTERPATRVLLTSGTERARAPFEGELFVAKPYDLPRLAERIRRLLA